MGERKLALVKAMKPLRDGGHAELRIAVVQFDVDLRIGGGPRLGGCTARGVLGDAWRGKLDRHNLQRRRASRYPLGTPGLKLQRQSRRCCKADELSWRLRQREIMTMMNA